MLASTVQFSNNDQTPTLEPSEDNPQVEPASQKEQSFPEDPTACPALATVIDVPRSEEQYWPSLPRVPNSQRSTHEQPCETFARSRLCAP